MEHEQSLVIDPGSRTFDWLVARGMKLSHKQSHSVDRGVSNILQLIADDISQEIGKPYTNLDSHRPGAAQRQGPDGLPADLQHRRA
jgi:plasmid segregation protein ParM